MTVGFLGPPPTFAERAARALAPAARLVSRDDIAGLFAALAASEVEAIVTPFENSAAGRVEETIAALRAQPAPLGVLGEALEPVRLSLYRRAGDEAPLGRVLGHPAALLQCKRWIARHHAAPIAAGSNGAAFAAVAASARPGAGALAPPGCGTDDMIEWAQDCQGANANATRFLLLGPHAPPAAQRALVWSDGSGAVEIAFPRAEPADLLPGRPLLLWAHDAPAGSRTGWPSATAHVWRVE